MNVSADQSFTQKKMYDPSTHDKHPWIAGTFEAADQPLTQPKMHINSTHDMRMHPWIADRYEDEKEATEEIRNGKSSCSSLVVRKHGVVCGREKLCYSHPGNRAFRDIVRAHCGRYNEATRRNDKTDIVQEINQDVERRGGRFLQRSGVGGGGGWVPVDPDKVHDKISHALRIAIKSSSKRRSRLVKRKGGRATSMSDSDDKDNAGGDETSEPIDCDSGDLLEPLDYNTRSVFDLAFSETAIL
jgi:hypothetical protein